MTGVYLILNGMNVQNNSCISAHDIGTAPPHQLACITDRVPCCSGPPPHGDWYNEQAQPVDSSMYHINRTDEGEINLFRLSQDVIVSAGGRVCCRVDDFTGVFHTAFACVNLGLCCICIIEIMVSFTCT